jgi:hypothetical protein
MRDETETNKLKVNNRNLTLLLADSLCAIQQHLHSITREHIYDIDSNMPQY